MSVEQLVKEDIGGTICLYHYDSETIATASELTGVTCTVYKSGGATLIDATAITPAADGKMSVTISAANAAVPDVGYRARFQYTKSTQVHTEDVWFVIAPTSFSIPVHFSELEAIVPDLDNWDDTANNYHFYKQRTAAESQLYYRLLNAGYEPHKLLRRNTFNSAFTWLWLKLICEGVLAKTDSDYWAYLAEKSNENYEAEFARLDLIVDDTDDANIGTKPTNRMGEVLAERS